MTFATFVKNERIKREMSFRQFSNLTHVTVPVLMQIEDGYMPTARLIGKLINNLNYDYLEVKKIVKDI